MDDPILNQMLAENGWITEEQVALLEGVEPTTVRSRRSRGQMPPYYKIGQRILYAQSDIADRIRANRKVSQGGKGATASADVLS
ncbi:MAG: helix-turn-helix domain-containing protein [Shimia sp.]|uniref:helix-turn-helix domain-containing protein n=1 Tax=Shimia sp. TaxID=1954381 RepID=UPI003B8AD554